MASVMATWREVFSKYDEEMNASVEVMNEDILLC